MNRKIVSGIELTLLLILLLASFQIRGASAIVPSYPLNEIQLGVDGCYAEDYTTNKRLNDAYVINAYRASDGTNLGSFIYNENFQSYDTYRFIAPSGYKINSITYTVTGQAYEGKPYPYAGIHLWKYATITVGDNRPENEYQRNLVRSTTISTQTKTYTFSTPVDGFDIDAFVQQAKLIRWEICVETLPVIIPAVIDIDPDTLNLRSKGHWITACIQLPEGYDPEDIDATTILLTETIQPVLDPKYDFVTNSSEYLVDHNEDGILERMVKFDRVEVIALLSVVEATLTITGEVSDTPFEGSDTIRVID